MYEDYKPLLPNLFPSIFRVTFKVHIYLQCQNSFVLRHTILTLWVFNAKAVIENTSLVLIF